jgi:hypothetical protein
MPSRRSRAPRYWHGGGRSRGEPCEEVLAVGGLLGLADLAHLGAVVTPAVGVRGLRGVTGEAHPAPITGGEVGE